MCLEIPCKDERVRLLQDFQSSDGTEIPSGTEGIVQREYLEEREIEVEFQLPEGPHQVRVGEDYVIVLEEVTA